MRAVMNEWAAVTVNTANHIRTGFVSDHPKSRPESFPAYIRLDRLLVRDG